MKKGIVIGTLTGIASGLLMGVLMNTKKATSLQKNILKNVSKRIKRMDVVMRSFVINRNNHSPIIVDHKVQKSIKENK